MMKNSQERKKSESDNIYINMFSFSTPRQGRGILVQVKCIKVVRKKKSNFLLPNMIELFETNRMSYLPPFYDDLFL